jgi:hypothetical protein
VRFWIPELLLLAAQCWLQVHALFKEQGGKLVDGYAPFCKHVFVPNFVGEPEGWHLQHTCRNAVKQ